MGRLLLLLTLLTAVAACGGAHDALPGLTPNAATLRPASPTASPASAATPAPAGAPELEHLVVPSGGTLDVLGAGIMFVDPVRGGADVWYAPAAGDQSGALNPFAFQVSSSSDDGRAVVYRCMRSTSSGLAPCSSTAQSWFLLDTERGDQVELRGFTSHASVSPDGTTLVGLTDDGLVVGDAAAPSRWRVIAPRSDVGEIAYRLLWSPASNAAVLRTGVAGFPSTSMLLARTDGSAPVRLPINNADVEWSGDGSLLALARYGPASSGAALAVADANGRTLWSTPSAVGYENVRFSDDSRSVAAQGLRQDPDGTIYWIDVYDALTGVPRARVHGAINCAGRIWAGDRTIEFSEYGGGGAMADLADGSITDVPARRGVEAPHNAGLGIEFDGQSFIVVDRATGAERVLVRTTVSPAWYWDHEPLFLGDGGIVATFPHLGHGGCGEGFTPSTPPATRIEYPPFAE